LLTQSSPAPDGDEWFHARIVLEGRQVKVFVVNVAAPSLVVNELSERTDGFVGLWCNGRLLTPRANSGIPMHTANSENCARPLVK
jgi:hypothetical protein